MLSRKVKQPSPKFDYVSLIKKAVPWWGEGNED